jgi:hypothetical protein
MHSLVTAVVFLVGLTASILSWMWFLDKKNAAALPAGLALNFALFGALGPLGGRAFDFASGGAGAVFMFAAGAFYAWMEYRKKR